jgi:chorismate mutase
VPVRAIRGATQLEVDERDHLVERVAEMLQEVLARNDVGEADLISVIFTSTPDVLCEFPAYAARVLGIADVPLLCAQEIDVPGAMPRVIRLLAHVETTRARAEIDHIYLHGASALRTDLRRDG